MVRIVYFLFIVVAGTAGELCVSRAMKQVGEVKNFRPRAILNVVLQSLQKGWMLLGIGLMTLAFFSLLGLLAIENVSFVVPVTAMSYVVGALGGIFFLGETVNWRRWAGILLVCAGVTLVIIGKG